MKLKKSSKKKKAKVADKWIIKGIVDFANENLSIPDVIAKIVRKRHNKRIKHRHRFSRMGLQVGEVWGTGDKTKGEDYVDIYKCKCGEVKYKKIKEPDKDKFWK